MTVTWKPIIRFW